MTLPLTGIEVEVLAKQLREAISFGQAQARKAGGLGLVEDQPTIGVGTWDQYRNPENWKLRWLAGKSPFVNGRYIFKLLEFSIVYC